jgi:hypothetical protein
LAAAAATHCLQSHTAFLLRLPCCPLPLLLLPLPLLLLLLLLLLCCHAAADLQQQRAALSGMQPCQCPHQVAQLQ